MRYPLDRRSLWYALAGTGAALALIALMAATVSGLPSRPRFVAVGVNVAAPATAGDIRATRLGLGTAPTITPLTVVGSSEIARFETSAARGTGSAWVQFYDPTGSKGYLGYGGANDNFSIANLMNGALDFYTNSSQRIFIAADGSTDLLGSHVEIENTSPYLSLNDSDATADNRLVLLQNTGEEFLLRLCTDGIGACSNFLTATRTTSTADSLDLSATVVTINGLPISGTGASGTFTASFDTACTTTPTVTYDWTRSGNIVVLYPVSSSGFTCTGDSTNFVTTGTPVPAAIRPNTNVDTSPLAGYVDNSASTWANVTVTSGGNISYNECTAFTTTCNGAGWTAAGTRSAPTLTTISYMLGNP